MFALCVAGYSLVRRFLAAVFPADPRARPLDARHLAGPRIGAYAYNLFHTLIMPLCLLAFDFLAGQDLAMQISAIWLAHIAIDRALG